MIKETQPGNDGSVDANDNPTGPVSRWYYDALGRQVATRDARTVISTDGLTATAVNGNVNGYVYDAAGNLASEIHADGGLVTHQYDAFGEEVRQTVRQNGSDSTATTYAYDRLGHRTQVTYAAVMVYGANASDQVTATYSTPQQLSETMTYDQAGRLLAKTAADGQVTTYRYDSHGNVIQTNVNGTSTFDVWDNHDRKTAEVDANGLQQTWTYDAFHLVSHGNLGGDTLSYHYDNAGRLYWQHSGNGRNQSYAYDGAGQLTRLYDSGINQTTTYAYDLAGNHVRERTVQNGVVYQDDHLGYDALGRLRYVGNNAASLRIDYDEAGNRTHIQTHRYLNSLDASGNFQSDDADRWFRYDAMNRQTLVDGTSAYAVTATQGHRITYDFAGDRLTDTSIGNRWGVVHTANTSQGTFTEYGAVSGTVIETYGYDALSRLTSITRNDSSNSSDGSGATVIDTRHYDAGGRVVQSGANLSSAYALALKLDGNVHVSRYDALGRLTHQGAYKANGYRDSTVDYTQIDAAGNVLGYTATVFDQNNALSYSTTTTIGYKRFEGYKESQESLIGHANDGSTITPSTTTSAYDVDGNLTSVTDSIQSGNNRTFINDAQGNALYVNQGGHYQRQLIVNGQVLGRYGEQVKTPGTSSTAPTFVDKSDFNFGYQPINGNYPGPAPGVYRVQNGDTLQGIAQGAFGDSSLWYLIAEANGIESNADLRIGQSLTIPNKVGTVHNSSGTFKPYDPGAIKASTSPTLKVVPPPPPSQDGGCGVVGTLVTMVVAVALAYFTPWAGSVWGEMLNAALASTAGQEAGVLAGEQDSINWKGVGLAAVSAGVTYGIVGTVPVNTGSAVGNVMARAAIANAMTQGIGVATGLQDHFDWRGVAASAAGAGMGAAMGNAVSQSLGADMMKTLGGKVISGTISGMAAGLTAAAMRGGRISVVQVAADAFGNALGSALAENTRQGAGGTGTEKAEDATAKGYGFRDDSREVGFHASGKQFDQGIVDDLNAGENSSGDSAVNDDSPLKSFFGSRVARSHSAQFNGFDAERAIIRGSNTESYQTITQSSIFDGNGNETGIEVEHTVHRSAWFNRASEKLGEIRDGALANIEYEATQAAHDGSSMVGNYGKYLLMKYVMPGSFREAALQYGAGKVLGAIAGPALSKMGGAVTNLAERLPPQWNRPLNSAFRFSPTLERPMLVPQRGSISLSGESIASREVNVSNSAAPNGGSSLFRAVTDSSDPYLSREALARAGQARADLYQAWKADNAAKYASLEDQVDAYKRLVSGESPWPDGFVPSNNTLPAGTRIRMALSPGQSVTSPGGFGTLDSIPDVGYVRNDLAVKMAWKPDVSGVAEYEVTQPLLVREGPVGPQIDLQTNRYLRGGGSQVNLNIPRGQSRMDYLGVIGFTPF